MSDTIKKALVDLLFHSKFEGIRAEMIGDFIANPKRELDSCRKVFEQLICDIPFEDISTETKRVKLWQTLTYLPIFCLKEGSIIKIPDFDERLGHFVGNEEYRVRRLAMTPKWLGLSTYFAYALEPVNPHHKKSILAFLPTMPVPFITGGAITLLADPMPFGTIGLPLYFLGKQTISRWIAQQKEQNFQVTACGNSLGGALSLRYQVDNPQINVFAHNPPFLNHSFFDPVASLYKKNVEKLREQGVAIGKSAIATQANDIVSSALGNYLPKNTTIYHLTRPKGACALYDHIGVYAGQEAVKIKKEKLNISFFREVLNFFASLVFVPIFMICVLVALTTTLAYNTITRPMKALYDICSHKGYSNKEQSPRDCQPHDLSQKDFLPEASCKDSQNQEGQCHSEHNNAHKIKQFTKLT